MATHKCSAKTPDMYGVPNVHPCKRPATVERDGKWYCWQHDPEYVKAKEKKRRAEWDTKMEREAAKYRHIARNARLGKLITEETAALLENQAFRDGEPCSHPGCLSHVSHPCEGCGRIGGRAKAVPPEKIYQSVASNAREARELAARIREALEADSEN